MEVRGLWPLFGLSFSSVGKQICINAAADIRLKAASQPSERTANLPLSVTVSAGFYSKALFSSCYCALIDSLTAAQMLSCAF